MKDKDLAKIYTKMKKDGEVKGGRVSKKKPVGKPKTPSFHAPSYHAPMPQSATPPWWNYWGQGSQPSSAAGSAGNQGAVSHGYIPRPEMRSCLWCRQNGHLMRNCPMRAPPPPPPPGPPPK
jgi:hypothetical protein